VILKNIIGVDYPMVWLGVVEEVKVLVNVRQVWVGCVASLEIWLRLLGDFAHPPTTM
jgi:hypothetical protein